MDSSFPWYVVLFVVILVALVALRMSQKGFEVKPGDIAAAALPVVLVLMVEGKIKSFQFGDLKFETAFREASATAIHNQVAPLTSLPIEPIEAAAKGGPGQLRHLQTTRAEGLTFSVGENRYAGEAIHEYLRTLPTLRHLVLQRPDGTLLGIVDAAKTAVAIAGDDPALHVDDVAKWINTGDSSKLESLPGYVAAKDAVTQTTEKQEVLKRMESMNLEVLPVVDSAGHFTGVVNRSRVTASMLVDIAARLKP